VTFGRITDVYLAKQWKSVGELPLNQWTSPHIRTQQLHSDGTSYFFIYLFVSYSDFFYLLVVGVAAIVALYPTQWHTHTHTHTHGRTPLDNGSTRRRDLYVTTHTTHKTQTSKLPAGFEPALPASEWPQTHALDHAVTGPITINLFPCSQSLKNCKELNQFCEI
jgi:hypothetical protein